MKTNSYKPIIKLSKETAGKIAAGEVIERPASVIRELMDNAIDAGASKIFVEIENGGIDSIRVNDDGCGMSKEDLELCTETHTTSKIKNAEDLLKLNSLGFRGEALSSIQSVSNLEIISTRKGPSAWKFSQNKLSPARFNKGTSIEVKNLFENFPARKKFLKRTQYEAKQCRQIFIEKALPHYEIEMRYFVDGANKIILPPHSSFKERLLATMQFKEPDNLFYELNQSGDGFEYSIVLGSAAVVRSDKRNIYVFVNGRRINEYGLVQAISYGSDGYFPNGGFPVAFLFLNVSPERIDFNIHPAKKEAKFEDYKEIHHSISETVGNFYKQKAISAILKKEEYSPEFTKAFNFEKKTLEEKTFGNRYPEISYTQENYTTKDSPEISSDIKNIYQANKTNHTSYNFHTENISKNNFENIAPKDIPKANFKFLGQFCETFIAVEKDDALFIVDQHAAHERIIFDELNAEKTSSQELLIPYKIQTESEKDDQALRSNLKDLEKIGFHISEEKKGEWLITAVPLRWKGKEKDLQKDIAEAGKNAKNFMHDILASTSCRAACKSGDSLDPIFAYNLVAKAFALPEPFCPHGRPVYFSMDRDELYKRVKRTGL